MIFDRVPIREAVGAINVHGVRAAGVVLKKGAVVTPEIATRLQEAGIDGLVVARLEAGDVPEDEAAHRLARAVAGEGIRVEAPFTGRSNLFAEGDGLLVIDRQRVDAVNAVDEAVTLATLPAYKPVVAGEMVATVKIIPYAAPAAALDEVLAVAGFGLALRVAPWLRRRVGVISTLLPGLKPATVAKTVAVLSRRLEPAGAAVASHVEVPHETGPLADAIARTAPGCDLLIVFGASAVSDRRDVIPAAIGGAGGTVRHFGMPVDPGNLLLLGEVGACPVIGAPGCARSPKENGFDWVLQRLLAGLPVTRADIVSLGVGGLLMEIVSRPQPRAGGESAGDEDE